MTEGLRITALGKAAVTAALCLGPAVDRGAVTVRADCRDMHQRFHAFRIGDPGDPAGSVGLHGLKVVPAAPVKGADAVHHGIRPPDHGTHAGVIADVAGDRFYLAWRAIGFDEQRFVRATTGDANPPAFLGHGPCDVASDKARTAKDGDQLAHLRALPRAPTGTGILSDH
jgi:hypothetical protein